MHLASVAKAGRDVPLCHRLVGLQALLLPFEVCTPLPSEDETTDKVLRTFN